ncbi:type I secretion system permease/ATPase [Sneathiella aquimaris]|uniref:type I secretion system permease/ATPase n=1 Tax=Sneathiella aquimaris TaxID=2599305 RepID=UPI00146D019A|nr:type I secretion system permease/ATPase [Sneathiella aquimaris]
MKQNQTSLLQETLSRCKRVFVIVALFGLGINLLMLTAPLFMMQVFDRVITSRNTDTLFMLVLVAIIALVTMSALESVRTFVLVRLSNWLDVRIGSLALKSSILSPLKKGETPSVQGLRDLSTFRGFLTGAGIFPILDAPFAPVFLGIMFLLHPMLGGIALAGAGILFLLALFNEIATRRLLNQSGQQSILAMGQAEAAARNSDVIEAMGMMPNLIARWEKANSKALDMQARASDRGGIISSLSKFFRTTLQIAVSSAGAWLVIAGDMSPGAMIASSIIMGRALAPVEQAIGAWKGFLGARSAYARLKARIGMDTEAEKTMPLPRPSGAIDVEAVSYAHAGSAEPVLRNVSFKINPGEVVGLIGPTAAGKSTLARILVGNLMPRSGHARLDNMDVAEWPADDRGQYIGYLPQDIELFAGTIRENIARMSDGDPDEVIAAAEKAGVHEMILRMEKGYDTQIGDGGAALSGGQRQRIALARAIYGNPAFMVLDEPNASLDSVGENALMQAMQTLRDQGMTIIVIAHRPNILKHVDKIVVLRNGIVDDFGWRDEILEKLQGPSHRALTGPAGETDPAPRRLKSDAVSGDPDETGNGQVAELHQFEDKGRAARIAKLQAMKRRADVREKEALAKSTQRPEPAEDGSRPEVSDAPAPQAAIAPISDKVRAEILSLADRSLTETEVQEIYTLYSAGDKQKMLEKLKGVG